MMAATPALRDRLSFLHRLPLLLKGTSDDDAPCPGYLFEEIARISHESPGSSQCLLEYLLTRLHSGSGRVKLKVLKILLHLCGHGSPSSVLILKRNPAFIQEAAAFSGPPDPLHGNSLYQKVRAAAQDLGSALFSDSVSPPPHSQAPRGLLPAGMGSQSRPQGSLQGFGYSKERGHTGSAGEAFLSTIQKAAEVVANAVRPGPESPGTQRPLPRGDAYQPAVTPLASQGGSAAGKPLSRGFLGARGSVLRPQPGQAGGGWDEPDSSSSSQNSSQESGDRSKALDSGSRSGSDSPSAASQAPSDLAERVEAVSLSDCQQEQNLVQTVTCGPHAFLSQEEAQRFIKGCGLLNCEAVLELLTRHLDGPSECAQMRALGAIASLGRTDLLSQEHILLLTRPRLQELSAGSPGPVTNKATKILRHFEASCRQQPPARRLPAAPSPAAARVGLSDLLTDTVPFAGNQAFLQPLSSTLFSPEGSALPPPLDSCPPSVPGDAREAETRLAGSRERVAGSEWSPLGVGPQKGAPESSLGPSCCLQSPVPSGSCSSLFAGMELVACPRLVGAGTTTEKAPQVPWTLSQKAAAREPPGPEPSAFPFLNS
ncbi:AP-4 complex accessory subunit tepsin isoform X1 [Canis lupus familiaris]|uniref:AP-4 complex accessory subunit Tepsin n=3 Tax=Canis lupus TaxID=9612 RepID=A0A8I3NG78_CANLF|nr:AP-4 complex accessory subunit tepsin isoform X1 [Canis lupus familiaris]XP_025324063.1 AP-4 complex accessory subunit tepsin isoform X1 [Canis lupus dingo]XP_038402269.1 AP-4 complex accessory subunit tepsin isoform X1 [Canis lupus familiaris]XP_038531392.1 AP-4 complex accessory subunit tepsin isoform X1 [Canis lupus familiaris]|eukprot:XP_005624071.1 AP-4 complex accessory subunit tepsin [Canis lupus familiaris]